MNDLGDLQARYATMIDLREQLARTAGFQEAATWGLFLDDPVVVTAVGYGATYEAMLESLLICGAHLLPASAAHAPYAGVWLQGTGVRESDTGLHVFRVDHRARTAILTRLQMLAQARARLRRSWPELLDSASARLAEGESALRAHAAMLEAEQMGMLFPVERHRAM